MSHRERITTGVSKITALPTAAGNLARLLDNPDVKMNEVIQLLEYDPGWTSTILRVANSAFFSPSKPIDSIKSALFRLGLSWIHKIAMASSLGSLKNSFPGYDLGAVAFIEHSIFVALTTEELSGQLGLRAPSHVFTAGLMHDVGKVLLGQHSAVPVGEILESARKNGLTFEAAERLLLGIDHAESGALLLKYWGFPQTIVEIVRWHHQPSQPGKASSGTDLVHVANQLARLEQAGTEETFTADPKALERLRYQPERGATATEAARKKLKDLAALFLSYQ